MSVVPHNVVPFPKRGSEPLLTLRQVMERYGFSERWFRYRLKEGLPAHRWGGQWRFKASEVEAWMRGNGHAA